MLNHLFWLNLLSFTDQILFTIFTFHILKQINPLWICHFSKTNLVLYRYFLSGRLSWSRGKELACRSLGREVRTRPMSWTLVSSHRSCPDDRLTQPGLTILHKGGLKQHWIHFLHLWYNLIWCTERAFLFELTPSSCKSLSNGLLEHMWVIWWPGLT